MTSWLHFHVCVTYQTPLLEVLVISAPEPLDGDEASIEQSPENQAPTPRTSLGGVETEENTLGDEKSNNENYSKFQKKVSFHEKDRNKKIPQNLDFDQTSEATMSTLA